MEEEKEEEEKVDVDNTLEHNEDTQSDPGDVEQQNKVGDDEMGKAEEMNVAIAVRDGGRCGHCRVLLDEDDACFECTHDEKQGALKYHYICEHVFHAKCIFDHYSDMYQESDLPAIVDGLAWIVPFEWVCPSCKGCVYTKEEYRANNRVVYCQFCVSPFQKIQAALHNNTCFYCQWVL